MAIHDYVIANQNGANTRSDLNNALAAIVSNNSSATAPSTTYAFQWWADTAADILKQRNAADSAWINILTLSTGAPLATIANFTSTGIDDNATSTAITIDASESVGIVTATPQAPLHVTGTIKVATGNAQGILALGEGLGTGVNVGLWRGAANNPTSDGNYLNLGGYSGIVFATGAAAIGSQTERMRLTDNGLTFNGDTAAANALDDYEEGTWTPTNTESFTLTDAGYTKIGNVVTAWMNITAGAAELALQWGGLPFSSSPSDRFGGFASFSTTDATQWGGLITGSTTFQFQTGSAGKRVGAGDTMRFTFVYLT